MKTHNKLGTAGIIAFLITSPTAVYASENLPAVTLNESSQISTAASLPLTMPPLAPGTPDMGVSDEQLLALVGTQTEAQRNAITTSSLPAVLLADDDGNIIAAARATPQIGWLTE